MHRNLPFLALLLFVILLTLLFGAKALSGLHRYYSLTNQVVLQVERWEIVGNGQDRYELIAHYTSPLGEGASTIGSPYRNPWAAEKAKESLENEALVAWFNPKKSGHLELNRKFPMKSLLSALVLVGLVLYFLVLGFYVQNLHQKR